MNKELKNKIKLILMEVATNEKFLSDGVAEILSLISARDDRLVEKLEKAKFPTEEAFVNDEVLGYNDGLADAIQLIREGEDGK